MLHILLIILKIIGIILLAALALVLLAVLVVLFVPVRYQVSIERTEEDGAPPIGVRGSVFWLLHLVNVRFRYPEKPMLRARIALRTLFVYPQESTDSAKAKKRKKKKTKETAKPEREDEAASAETEKISDVTQTGNIDTRDDKTVSEESGEKSPSLAEDTDTAPAGQEPQKDAETAGEEQADQRKSILQKLRSFVQRIIAFWNRLKQILSNIQYTIRRLCDKIKDILHNIQYYKEVFESDAFQQSFALGRGELGYALKHLKPTKLKADWIIGTGDPVLNSDILAVYGVCYPLVGQNVRIVADYDAKHIEGTALIKGRIRLYTLVRVAWRIYFNKNIRTLIRLLKKEAVTDGRK